MVKIPMNSGESAVARAGFRPQSRRAGKRRGVPAYVEVKYFDSNTTAGQQYGTGGVLSDVSAITQAVGGTSRIGDQVDLIRLDIRGTLYQQGTNPYSVSRLIVFQQFPVTTPTLATLLDPGVSGAADYTSMYNHDGRHLFEILHDSTYTMEATTGQGTAMAQFNISVPLKGRVANFAAAAATGDSHIYVELLGSNAAGATGQLVSMTCRLFFSDP